jgi:hypothetical protein
MRWQSGECRFGDMCNFAHGEAELRAAPPRGGPGGGRGRYDERGGGPGGNGGYFQGGGGGPGGYGDQYGRQQGGYGGPPGGGGGYSGYGGPQPGPYGGGPAAMGGGPQGDGNAEWASQGCPVPGPGDWVQYQTQDTHELYYHNHRTGETVWEKPPGWQ